MDAAAHLRDNPPMDYPRLETATLGELNDNDYFYGGDCQSCHRSQRISLERLRVHLGDAFPLMKVRARLKCSTCGSRKIIVSFWTPVHQGLPDVRKAFKEPAV